MRPDPNPTHPSRGVPAPVPTKHAPQRAILHALALVALALTVYLPGLFTIPPVDRDESRFAQASRQMLESVALPEPSRDPALHSGGLTIPRVAGRDRLKKPPLIYWLQSASAFVFTAGDPTRDAIWMYRVPSVLAALITVLATWRLARALMPPTAAFLSAALLAVCPLIVWDAHQARADQVLVAATTLAMLALWSIWSRRDQPRKRWRAPLIFWLAMGAGVMTKGPITPMIALTCALAMCIITREWRWLARLRPITGFVILAAMVAPWVIAVGQRVGWQEYLDLIVYETVGRSASAHEGHWGPPGYHAVLSAALFWPGSLLTLGAVAATCSAALALAPGRLRDLPKRWRARTPTDNAAVFLIAWLAPSWVIFELVTTKLPHYPMPLYPALALITGLAIDRAVRARTRPSAGYAAIVIWTCIGIAITALALYVFASLLSVFYKEPRPLFYVPACLGLLFVLAASLTAVRGKTLFAHASAMGAATITLVALLGFFLPRNTAFWSSPAIARHLDPSQPVAAVGYHEDSLVFLTRGRLERINADAAQDWLDTHPTGALVVPKDLAPTITSAHETAAVTGFNYSTGDDVDLRILRRDD